MLLSGCSSTQTTRNIEINELKIKEIIDSSFCKTGTHYSLYLDGVINEDSSFAIERILSQQITKCINDKGIRIVPSVYLNSRGGYLRDGYKLGETFTKYQVVTRINSGAVCMSACSTAFLGGLYIYRCMDQLNLWFMLHIDIYQEIRLNAHLRVHQKI